MFDSGLTKRALTNAPLQGEGGGGRGGWVGGLEGGWGVEFGWRIMKSYTECQTEETHRSLVLSCKER